MGWFPTRAIDSGLVRLGKATTDAFVYGTWPHLHLMLEDGTAGYVTGPGGPLLEQVNGSWWGYPSTRTRELPGMPRCHCLTSTPLSPLVRL